MRASERCYFGFAVPQPDGSEKFYQFRVLIYGCKPAVAIVTNLLKPVKAYLHLLGVKCSMYVDYGRVAAASLEEARAKMQFTLLVTQLAGWDIQWLKTDPEPAQKQRYLGVITDTVSMTHMAPEE